MLLTAASSAALAPLSITAENGLSGTIQIVALIGAVGLFGLVLELVRRRRLVERYALLWMLLTAGLVVLVIWTDLLVAASELLNIRVPSNLLFIAAIGVGFVLLLHFSVAISRLSEETKILAQDNARLDAELRAARGELPTANGSRPADGNGSAPQPREDEPHAAPVETQRRPE